MHRTTYPLDPATPLPDHELMFPEPEPEQPSKLFLWLFLMPLGAWGWYELLF